MTPSTQYKRIAGPIRRPEYQVRLELPDGARLYRLEATTLDALADIIEREVKAVHPNQHVGVRLDPNGTVLVRIGWTPSVEAGTWNAVAS